MANPELCVSSCTSHEEENHRTFNQHTSPSEKLLLEDQMRRKLKFFFMNPCEKFWARGRKPWKLVIQILKIAMVTIQLVLFGLSNQMVVTFKEENTIAFKHLFLKGYMDRMDDTYAVYTQSDVYDQIIFAMNQYLQLRNISVGNHAYENKGTKQSAMTICQHFYKQGNIYPGNDTFDIDPEIETECFLVEPDEPFHIGTPEENKLNFTLDFHRLVTVELQFKLKAINLQTVRHQELPDCYDFTLTITFDNKAHSGRIKISLDNDISIQECKDWHVSGSIQKNTHYMMIFDAAVILTCLSSLLLCIRSVVQGLQLQQEFVSFFLFHYKKEVSISDQMEFVNGWYIMIIVSDILTIIGSILKMEIQAKSLTSYDVCSIFLGTSTMLVWLGVIRYLGFFQKYNYHRLKNISLATLDYGENEDNIIGLKICKQHYKKGTMFSSNETLNIDSDLEIDCTYLDLQTLAKDPQDWMRSPFFRLEFYRLLQVEISFHLKGIDLQTIHSRELPDCYIFRNVASITFDNKAHSGKIKIYFDSDADIEECKDLNISGSIQKNTQYVLLFDAFVIVICLASLILCTRSVVLALRLRKRFLNFFLEKYQRRVCDTDQWEFINGWYVLVIISDLMTIIGSILKMEIKAKNLTNYDLCSILLGTSTLFVWVGVIRYLGYFQAYNVLILTMQASLPKVLRFCACAGMIYLGYTFCGWIVLGPYHEKFENLNTVAECLFSLVNGDDMFATFAQIQQKSILVWLFSRLYLYSFISLFIYMILSLFIALITDSYDTIKKYQQNGFPETDLQEFLKECSNKEESQKESSAFLSCVCCLRRSVLCSISTIQR
ncbi:Mucolipin-2 [Sciurus carolinensis]|uniref:Mucolipin-2 n=1 Tax=Sciurus carolinensis TaxID=30640 RepID=A0AA41TD85_SCICA|nr:Mucolipin-2 [Sciurus carolinensis]